MLRLLEDARAMGCGLWYIATACRADGSACPRAPGGRSRAGVTAGTGVATRVSRARWGRRTPTNRAACGRGGAGAYKAGLGGGKGHLWPFFGLFPQRTREAK